MLLFPFVCGLLPIVGKIYDSHAYGIKTSVTILENKKALIQFSGLYESSCTVAFDEYNGVVSLYDDDAEYRKIGIEIENLKFDVTNNIGHVSIKKPFRTKLLFFLRET